MHHCGLTGIVNVFWMALFPDKARRRKVETITQVCVILIKHYILYHIVICAYTVFIRLTAVFK